MNEHFRIRELLALQIYGEVDASDVADVEHHLLRCDSCREIARDLRAGLGSLASNARAADGADPLPDNLSAHLVAQASASTRGRLPFRALAAATVGFAAGALLTFTLLFPNSPLAEPSASPAPAPKPLDAFSRSSAPSPATTRGTFSTLLP